MNQTCPAQKQKANYIYKESQLICVQCQSFEDRRINIKGGGGGAVLGGWSRRKFTVTN